jgi:outer membrane protein insertion porin family
VSLAAASGAGAQLPSSGLEVEDVEFEGNLAFTDDSLRIAIVNRETSCRRILVVFCWLGFPFADDKEYLLPRELPSDMLRLKIYYYERGYREAAIDTAIARDPELDETTLTFNIAEGQPILIDSLIFFGADVLGEGALLENLPAARGSPLSTFLLDEVRDTLLIRLRNEGYVHADVLRSHYIPAAMPYLAQVTYDIDPGPQARVGTLALSVTGDAELSEQVIRRMLPFEEGSLYREADIQQAQRNLYNLELVLNALVEVDTVAMRTAPDTLVPLRIQVATGTLHRVRAGGGWSMSDCMNGEARWSSRNLFGGAQRLEVSGRLSNVLAEDLHDTACPYAGVGEFGGINWSLSTDLNFPWILSPRNSFSASLFIERQSLQDVFVRRSVGMNLTLTRSLGLRTPLVLFYRPQRSSLEAADIFFCTSLLVCNEADVGILTDPNWLSPAGLGISRERTDNALNPTTGYAVHYEMEGANALTGSDFGYARFTGDAAWYRSLGGRNVLAARVRAGWVGAAEFGPIETSGIQIIHPQKRFFAGGASSVRGFAQNRLGPSILTVDPGALLGPAYVNAADTVLLGWCGPEQVMDFTCDASFLADNSFTPRPTGGTRLLEGSLEYRVPVAGSFQGVGFLDFGQAWTEQTPFGLDLLEWTPGLGVRYFSPIGPLRLDVAYRVPGGDEMSVVTSRIRPFVPGEDDPNDQVEVDLLEIVNGNVQQTGRIRIPWLAQQELALLAPRVLFGADRSFWSRLQIHFSIGQAF